MFPIRIVVGVIVLISVVKIGICQENLADIIEQAEKSVVRINVESTEGASLGSGFVVSDDGRIATNVHVMAGARKANVTFVNGESFEIKGTYLVDKARDICICKIDSSGLRPLPFASALPRKGEQVTALGSPRGLSFTATTGIVSAIRSGEEMARTRAGIKGTWIQVDTSLSPGNSGGPLINRDGQLVAMSTLASFGQSQNLNFGVASNEIRAAVESSKGRSLTRLSQGTAKIEMDEMETASSSIRKPVPGPALQDYIASGREDFDFLKRELRKEYGRLNKTLSAMKRGKTFTRSGAPVEKQHIGRTVRYAFANASIKNDVISDIEKRVRKLKKLLDAIGTEATNDSLFALLWNYGPELDPRQKGSVGFLNEAVVLHAATEHDAIVVYQNVPYLIWVKDTSGLAIGQDLTPGPVHVVGAKTVLIPGQGSVAVTILNSVTELELEKAIFPVGRGVRTWSSKSGTFSKEAKYVSHDATHVVLESTTGKTMKVPIGKLSNEDRAYLENR